MTDSKKNEPKADPDLGDRDKWDPSRDRGLHYLVMGTLAIVAVASTIGYILVYAHCQETGSEIDSGLLAIASASIGALVAILTKIGSR